MNNKRSEQGLKQLALDVHHGLVFGSWMMPESDQKNLLSIVFMPLAMGAKFPADTFHLYGYVRNSFPRSINGYPILHACYSLNKEESNRLRELCEALYNQEQSFVEATV